VQVHPIKPTVTATGTKRLKLKCDKLLSNVAFKFNLRRYNAEAAKGMKAANLEMAKVGRCRFTLSDPR